MLSDELTTRLGTIETWVERNLNNSIVIYENNPSTTISYKIILQNFELPNKFQCNSYSPPKRVESIICWRWFIEKLNDKEEHLNIFCKLVNPQPNVNWKNKFCIFHFDKKLQLFLSKVIWRSPTYLNRLNLKPFHYLK